MSQEKLNQLKKLAGKVRRAVLKTRVSYTRDDSLAGACGTSSYHLMRCARKNGIHVKFVHGVHGIRYHNWHAWVEYGGHVIDITRTQFNYYRGVNAKKVEVIPFAEARYYSLDKPAIRTYSISEAWEHIATWAVYPEELKNNLITL